MTMRLMGGLLTAFFLTLAIIAVVTLSGEPYVTPENAGTVWTPWELTKAALPALGIWLAGYFLGRGTGGRPQ